MFTIEKYAVYRKVTSYNSDEIGFRQVADGLTLDGLREVLSMQIGIDKEDVVVGREVKQYEDVTEEFSWMIG